MTQHAPAPWRWGTYEGNEALLDARNETVIASFPYEGMWFSGAEEQANKEHIVRCVNAHDALVAALREANHALDDLMMAIAANNRTEAEIAMRRGNSSLIANRAALAKVTP